MGMSERMNEEEARATLLEVLQERLEEHRRDAAERDPWEGDILELHQPDFEQFSKILGWKVHEVSALYKRLVLGGFIRQVRGETEFVELGGTINVAWVEDLTDEGMKAIGVLHDPAEALAEALRAAIQGVADSEEIPEDKKTDVIAWLDRGISIARLTQGAAQVITQYIGS
jgi:hypothetical protein